MNLWKKCLDLLYPQTCYFCGKISKDKLCQSCCEKVIYIEEPRCKKCGKPIRYEEKELCYDCQQNDTYYEQGKSLWLHQGAVKWSVYQFKYHNRRIYGRFYAEELYRLYGKKLEDWRIDVIIPIPLHPKRRRKRGYNQAEIIAKHLGRISGIRVDRKAVVRVNDTKPQKQLNPKERKRNLQRAFRVHKNWEPVKRILLIDDIYTTGNTIDAVAKVLKEKGACKVWFLTISIGQGF